MGLFTKLINQGERAQRLSIVSETSIEHLIKHDREASYRQENDLLNVIG